ncbi:MAG: hypothetical protein MR616_01790 [Pyramidobacter sp.]|nr:hypothetical protein [Pyramidobacter sp.]
MKSPEFCSRAKRTANYKKYPAFFPAEEGRIFSAAFCGKSGILPQLKVPGR